MTKDEGEEFILWLVSFLIIKPNPDKPEEKKFSRKGAKTPRFLNYYLSFFFASFAALREKNNIQKYFATKNTKITNKGLNIGSRGFRADVAYRGVFLSIV